MTPLSSSSREQSKDVLVPEHMPSPDASVEIVSVPESAEVPAASPEISVDQSSQESVQSESVPLAAPIVYPSSTPRPVQDRLEQEIESILEEDLKELYLSLPAETRGAFKQKGEQVVSTIRTLVQEATVNVKKIFQLIKEWLSMIPGVNRFFLEQEAKIKSDKILLVTMEERRRAV